MRKIWLFWENYGIDYSRLFKIQTIKSYGGLIYYEAQRSRLHMWIQFQLPAGAASMFWQRQERAHNEIVLLCKRIRCVSKVRRSCETDDNMIFEGQNLSWQWDAQGQGGQTPSNPTFIPLQPECSALNLLEREQQMTDTSASCCVFICHFCPCDKALPASGASRFNTIHTQDQAFSV